VSDQEYEARIPFPEEAGILIFTSVNGFGGPLTF